MKLCSLLILGMVAVACYAQDSADKTVEDKLASAEKVDDDLKGSESISYGYYPLYRTYPYTYYGGYPLGYYSYPYTDYYGYPYRRSVGYPYVGFRAAVWG